MNKLLINSAIVNMKTCYRYSIFTIIIVGLLNCSGADKTLFYRAAERADVDIVDGRAGLIRSAYCDIYIENLNSESWDYLKNFKFFKGNGRGNPVDPCFHFIIVNTWDKPFIVDKIDVLYKGETISPEDYSFIRDKNYLENRYSVNISSFMKKRRLFTDKNLLMDIDFESESAEYRLDFIAPGDRVSLFTFFQRVPAGKKSKIRVSIKYFDIKKVIDFDIDRFEYTELEKNDGVF